MGPGAARRPGDRSRIGPGRGARTWRSTAGRIAASGPACRPGRAEVDVAGQVVTAGFIDLHSHVNDLGGLRLQALDGVTTALELEAGVTPVAEAYRRAAGAGPAGQLRLRRLLGAGPDGGGGRGAAWTASLGAFLARIADPAWQRAGRARAGQPRCWPGWRRTWPTARWASACCSATRPRADPAEYLRVAGLAAEAGVPTFTHARDLIEMVPATLADGAEEIVRAAGETGAHMHYCHINSTSQRHIDRVLGLVGRAQAAGSRVTTEAYPYGSGMTGIGAAFLAPERLGERGLTPSSLTYAPTGERVASEARLRELRAGRPGRAGDHRPARRGRPGRPGAADAVADLPRRGRGQRRHAADLDRLRRRTRWPGRCPRPRSPTRGRPARSAGRCACSPTAAGRSAWPRRWPSAAWSRPGCCRTGCRPCAARAGCRPARTPTSWCSTRPRSPTGPATGDSTRPSAGIRHVLVNGAFVVRDGGIVADARPGRPVRAEPR